MLGSYTALSKAEGGPVPTLPAKEPPKSLLVDPYLGVTQMGYRDRFGGLSHQMLRHMVKKVPVVASVIQTRCNQVSSFARVQNSRYDVGFRVQLRDASAQPSKAARTRAKQLEQFILHSGVQEGADPNRDDFATFLKKLTRDSLTVGHEAFEIVANRRAEPAEFLAVDATTIRLAEMTEDTRGMSPDEVVRYVQVYENQVIAEYTWKDLAFSHRIPTTDLAMNGYGLSELEMLVDIIYNLINISDYNGNFFSNNSTPKGLINLRGTVSNEMLEGFRRHWYALLSGVENSWKTPIAATEGIDWIPMQQTNADMQMENWLNVMVRTVAAVFAISPEEIGFGMGPMGMTSSLNAPTNEDKITEGRQRGLNPILTHFGKLINLHLVHRIDPDFTFEFRGLEGETRDQRTQLASQQVTTTRTIDEIRAEDDLPAMPDGTGKIILNPAFLQYQAQLAQAQQPQPGPEQGQDEREPDDGGDEAGADGGSGGTFEPDNAAPEEESGDVGGDAGGDGELARSLTGGGRLGMPGLKPLTQANAPIRGWWSA